MESVDSAERPHAIGRWMWYWAPLALYAGIIFYLSSLSHPEDELPELLIKQVGDKVLHLVEYGVLGVLCYRAFRWGAGPVVARQALMLAIVAASFYGLTDEWHQSFVPPRESSWLDWVTDTVGGVIGSIGWSRVARS